MAKLRQRLHQPNGSVANNGSRTIFLCTFARIYPPADTAALHTFNYRFMGQRLKNFCWSLIHKKYLWTILFFIVVVGFVDPNSFWHRYEMHQQNEELRAEIKDFEDRYNADTHELNELEHNPEAVERVARVNLYMKTANEDVYVIESDNTNTDE